MSSISFAIGKFVGANRVLTVVGLALMLGTCTYMGKEAEEKKRVETERTAKVAAQAAAKRRDEAAVAEARRREQLADSCKAVW